LVRVNIIDVDTWQETLETIRKNKLRALLTAFSVAWGILMLVVLLGSGRGLTNGVEYGFRDDATNSIRIRSGQTSVPYRGLQPGRIVQFTNLDYDDIKQNVAGIDHITSRFSIRGALAVTYRGQSSSYNVRCVHPDYQYLEQTIILQGRYLNPTDIAECRKVAVIGDKVQTQFGKGRPLLGEYIQVNSIPFLVVGISTDEGSDSEREAIYLPISTAQRAFGGSNRVAMIGMTVEGAGVDESNAITDKVRKRIAERHDFDPQDQRAVFIYNALIEFQRFVSLMSGIRLFVWIIGVGTLLAGVVGVSNIMMIGVKERTKEIGIRKALGATPWSIMRLILQEAVLVTAVAGYGGLVVGVAVLQIMAQGITGSDFFRHPSVDLGVALSATALLVVSGAIAGYFPARRAASIRPVEALRDE
jgi:putative ABC transport system permease protein